MIHLSEQVKLAELGTELAIVKSHGQHTYLEEGPQGLLGSGENGYFFSGSWGALVIILGELGSKLIILGIKEALPESKKKKGKASILLDFLNFSSASGGASPPDPPLKF